ncbi:MAG TPA: TonB-dependent receptor [Flavobacteriaceae bacterium]|nr:TonB-dependent receptor [Flavobacteriaceae bacterium]
MKMLMSVFLLATTLSFAQQNTHLLRGVVSSNDKPVAFANVFFKDSSIGTQTDENGVFFLPVSKENTVLIVSVMGYHTVEIEIQSNQFINNTIHIQLKENFTELDAIVLLDKQSGLTRRTPYAVSSLNLQDITQNSNPGGIAGSLKDISGINGAEMGPGIVKPFIRGLGFSRVVTIYQNNKLENHQWGQDHGLGLNTLGVKSVDVIKGPASILYGSGAVGGVLLVKDNEDYLQSEKPKGTFGTSYHSVSQGLRTYGSIGNKLQNNLFVAADLAYESHADYKAGAGRLIGNSRFNNHTLRLHSGIDKDKFKSKLSFTYHKQNLGIIQDDEMQATLATSRSDRKMQLPFQEISDYLASYSQETFHDTFDTYLHLSHHFNDRNEIEEEFSQIDLGLRQNHTFFSGRITSRSDDGFSHTFGVQASAIQTQNKKKVTEILLPDANTKDIGIYYLGSKRFKGFYLQGGLRFDYRNVKAMTNSRLFTDYGFVLPGNPKNQTLTTNFSGFTGSLGSSFYLSDFQQIKINLSAGFRAPDLAELFSNGPHPGTNRFEMGNANFDREQSIQADVTYVFDKQWVSFSTSIYYNTIAKYIFFTNTGEIRPQDGLEIWAFQQQDAQLYGGEADLKILPMQSQMIEMKVVMSLVRGTLKRNKHNLTFIPADSFRIKAFFRPDFMKHTTFGMDVNFISEQNRPGFNELQTPAYTLVNLFLSKDFSFQKGTLSTSVNIQNLWNKKYVDHLSILRAFEIPNPGRNLQLALHYAF